MNERAGKPQRVVALVVLGLTVTVHGGEDPPTRVYESYLKPIANPGPLLADYPQFVEPVREVARFEAPALINDAGADLDIRPWRISYNARGIIEVPNRLRGPNRRDCGTPLGH